MRCLSLLVLIFSTLFAHAGERLPNVVLIFCDDLGYGDLGCYGAKNIKTPHLDTMAAEGTRFTHFRVAQAVCSASRAALLTGCYPNRIGIAGALFPTTKHGIHDNEVTLAEALKSRGYKTAMYGKWHLGHHPQFLPTRHGFDEYYGLPYSNDMNPLPLIEGEKTIELKPDQSLLTGAYTQRAVKFIEANKAQPFFVYIAHSMPHIPIFASEAYRGKSAQGLYGDVIQEIDASVGSVLDALKKNGVDQDTLVIFTSDNGPWLVFGNHGGSAGGLRDGKGTAWEGGVRVPCVMRWPGKIPAARVCGEALMTIDVFPTIAKLAGAELPKHKIDGLDVWPVIAGQDGAKSPHEAYFGYYTPNELRTVISGTWKLVFPHTFRFASEFGKDGKGGKVVNKKAELALYNLSDDPAESVDVQAKHPEIVERLSKLAEEMRKDLGDSLLKVKGDGVRPAGQLPQ
jgi:arylsulfatase A